MRLSWNLNSLCCAVLSIALAITPFTVDARDVGARDDGIKRELKADQKIAFGDGGELTRNMNNVLIDRFNECRWLDNNSPDLDYFVPTGKAEDWASFRSNAPSQVRIDGCCPDVAVTLIASDGQTFNVAPGLGRENSSGPFGVKNLSHNFTVTNEHGAVYTETVTEQFICRGGVWEGQGASYTGEPGSWSLGDWSVCSADCEGQQTRSVVCLDSEGAAAPDSACGGPKPASTQACGEETCSLTDPNGVCGTAAGRSFDRATPPPASTSYTLCANGAAKNLVRKNAVTWEWQCAGIDSTAVCSATRTGAAAVVKSDCRPADYNAPDQSQWHNADNYYTYVCGVDRRMPKNSYLTAAHWQIPQMVNNHTGKYSCLQAGWTKMIGATTGGDDWHKAYYTGWTPAPGTTGNLLSDYYQSSRGDQCQGCVVLENLYCTDEEDFPLGCAEKDVEYLVIPPAGACEPPREEQGRLPTGHFGQSGTMGNTKFVCGLYGWENHGTVYNEGRAGMSPENIECW